MTSPTNPDLYKPIHSWHPNNKDCYARFRDWLRQAGYSNSTLSIYGCAARLAFSQLDKPYWQISEEELRQVHKLIADRFDSVTTSACYVKGLNKLADFLRQRQGQPRPQKQVNWSYFLNGLPSWLADDVGRYLRHRQRAWLPEMQYERTGGVLSHLTQYLRWAAQRQPLHQLADLNPALWFVYLDERLAAGLKPTTVNGELKLLQPFLAFLAESGQVICERMLAVDPLPQAPRLPRDVAVAHLRQVYGEIEAETTRLHRGIQRTGIMDRAWFLLMLHSGLRVGEVRRLRRSDLNLAEMRIRIEQSKGLKDRIIFISTACRMAIEAYLPLRGPVLEDHLFVYRHRPLTSTFCQIRLRTYGKRCGVTITPHRLRHSCATLLLNAGAPILTVQALLGHKHIDTTLRYARLYDSTMAADYYRAMSAVEQQLQIETLSELQPTNIGQLVALADALQVGTLNAQQRELLHTLRSGLLSLTT